MRRTVFPHEVRFLIGRRLGQFKSECSMVMLGWTPYLSHQETTRAVLGWFEAITPPTTKPPTLHLPLGEADTLALNPSCGLRVSDAAKKAESLVHLCLYIV